MHDPVIVEHNAFGLPQTRPQLAAREDADVSAALLDLMRDEGITVHQSAQVQQVVGRSGDAVSVRLRLPDGER